MRGDNGPLPVRAGQIAGRIDDGSQPRRRVAGNTVTTATAPSPNWAQIAATRIGFVILPAAIDQLSAGTAPNEGSDGSSAFIAGNAIAAA